VNFLMIRFDRRFTKVDVGLIVALSILVVMTIIFIVFDQQIGVFVDFFFSLQTWTQVDPSMGSIGFLIIYISCFLGALIPIPVPYFFGVSFISLWGINAGLPWPIAFFGYPLMAAFIGTLGNFSGEIIDFFIGRGGREILAEETVDRVNKWGNLMENRPAVVPFIIFLFALTPLPDSILLVPLGLSGYSMKKTMTSCFFGKLAMMLVIAYGIGILGFSVLLTLLGGTGESWVSGMILFYVTVIIVWIMLKLEFDEVPKEE